MNIIFLEQLSKAIKKGDEGLIISLLDSKKKSLELDTENGCNKFIESLLNNEYKYYNLSIIMSALAQSSEYEILRKLLEEKDSGYESGYEYESEDEYKSDSEDKQNSEKELFYHLKSNYKLDNNAELLKLTFDHDKSMTNELINLLIDINYPLLSFYTQKPIIYTFSLLLTENKATIEQLYPVIHAAAQNGHIKAVDLLLAYDINHDITKEQLTLSFYAAVENKHTEIAELLLGCYINYYDSPALALNSAAENGHTEIVKLLYKHDINHDITKEQLTLSFYTAVENKHTEIAELLLGCYINYYDSPALALKSAAENGYTMVVRSFIKRYNNYYVIMKEYVALALNAAAKYEHIDIVELLLGRYINYYDSPALALNSAAENGYTELVKLLYKNDINHDINGEDLGLALNAAAKNEHIDIVELLLGCYINYYDSPALALNSAVKNGRTKTLELLTDFYINYYDSPALALNAAAENGHTEIVKLLYKHDINGEDLALALNAAAKNEYIDIVELLLGCYIKYYDSPALALNSAAKNGYTMIVRSLIKPYILIRKFITIEDLALALNSADKNRHINIIELLADCYINHYDSPALALNSATENGHTEIVKLLNTYVEDKHITPSTVVAFGLSLQHVVESYPALRYNIKGLTGAEIPNLSKEFLGAAHLGATIIKECRNNWHSAPIKVAHIASEPLIHYSRLYVNENFAEFKQNTLKYLGVNPTEYPIIFEKNCVDQIMVSALFGASNGYQSAILGATLGAVSCLGNYEQKFDSEVKSTFVNAVSITFGIALVSRAYFFPSPTQDLEITTLNSITKYLNHAIDFNTAVAQANIITKLAYEPLVEFYNHHFAGELNNIEGS